MKPLVEAEFGGWVSPPEKNSFPPSSDRGPEARTEPDSHLTLSGGSSMSFPALEPLCDVGPGDKIGPYKLRSILVAGGFGVVFLAEQEQPLRRKVALKVLKPTMDNKAIVARFEAERQALALMNHARIAKVLDAGETEKGRPYFVMEFVPGEPLTDYCDRHRLPTKERLELFIEVCEAVQHAHQKAIIHRDLKPSNMFLARVGPPRNSCCGGSAEAIDPAENGGQEGAVSDMACPFGASLPNTGTGVSCGSPNRLLKRRRSQRRARRIARWSSSMGFEGQASPSRIS